MPREVELAYLNARCKVETDKALHMLSDMLRRGYLVAVEMPDGTYVRAESVEPGRPGVR